MGGPSTVLHCPPLPRYIPSFLSIAWMQEGNHKTETRRFLKQACHMLLNSNVLPATPPAPPPPDEKAAPANLPVTVSIRARGWPSAGVFPLFFSSNQRNPKRTLTHPPSHQLCCPPASCLFVSFAAITANSHHHAKLPPSAPPVIPHVPMR